jgi:hemerythrin-like domain-containing protein
VCDHCGCRNVGPTAELTREHDEILVLAWRVAEADDLDSGPGLEALEAFAELHGRHSRKEELGLFPLVLEGGDCTPEQIDTLVAEHRELDRNLAARRFSRRDYYALAAHIEAEESEVFPMAMFGFDNIMWDDMEHAHRHVDAAAGISDGPGGP